MVTFPPREERNASRFPSADHFGFHHPELSAFPFVRFLAGWPGASCSQMSSRVFGMSRALLIWLSAGRDLTNATAWPSGDRYGFRLDLFSRERVVDPEWTLLLRALRE